MCATMSRAENPEDLTAIKATARNYMESWYQGDVRKMKASITPHMMSYCQLPRWNLQKMILAIALSGPLCLSKAHWFDRVKQILYTV